MKHRPNISVCMATFNGEKWVYEQIASILPQLLLTDELIIADDGSNDLTLEIVRSFKDPRIRILSVSNQLGPTKNFERALLSAKGDILFLSDQDDIWLKKKVEKVLEALENSLLVMHDANIVDSKLNVTEFSYFRARKVSTGVVHNTLFNGYTGAFMAFKRELLIHACPFPVSVHHDQWLGIISELIGKSSLLNDKLTLWRRHSTTHTSLVRKSVITFFGIFPQRLSLIYHLLRFKSYS